jgi:hypothetical protein
MIKYEVTGYAEVSNYLRGGRMGRGEGYFQGKGMRHPPPSPPECLQISANVTQLNTVCKIITKTLAISGTTVAGEGGHSIIYIMHTNSWTGMLGTKRIFKAAVSRELKANFSGI